MAWPLVIAGGVMAVGAAVGAGASLAASDIQRDEARAARHLQEKQMSETQKLLAPYTQAGQGALAGLQPYQQAGLSALEQQQALLGLGGQQAQQAAMAQLQNDPAFRGLAQQGEAGILQNAAATGGLRGGNTQAALAQFRPQLLNQFMQQRLAGLGGLAGMGQATTQNIAGLGQASAAGVGAAGQQTAGAIGNLMQQQGAASAGGLLGVTQSIQGGLNQGLGLAAYSGMFNQGAGGMGQGTFGVPGAGGYNMAGMGVGTGGI